MSNRRDFLKTAGLITLGSALISPSKLFAQNQRGNSKSSGSNVMKLTWKTFDAKMKYTFTVAGSSRTTTQIVLTQITWNGYTGYGEAAMPPYLGETQASVVEFLKKVDLSRFKDPFMIEDIMTYVDGLTTNNTAAKAAVDIALHDIVGQIFGQPWWKIWGFNPEKTPYTSYTIGLDTEEIVRKKTQEEANNFKVLKVKVGVDDKTDRMMINTIRSVAPDNMLYVDANQGWRDKFYALDMINWLADNGVTMIEQPLPKLWLDETAWITERSPIPVIADESCQRLTDVQKLKGAFSGINIKLMKCTGLREAREMISLANTLNMRLMIGCMTETSCAISAAAQLSPKVEWADLDGNLLIAEDQFDGVKLSEGGRITLNDRPGIGVKPL